MDASGGGGGCGSGNCGSSPLVFGRGDVRISSLEFELKLGGAAAPGFLSGGSLMLRAEHPSAALFTPSALRYTFDTRLVYASPTKTAGGLPRQVRLLDRGVDTVLFQFDDNSSIGIPQAKHRGMDYRLQAVDSLGAPVLTNAVYYELVYRSGNRDRYVATPGANFGTLASVQTWSGRSVVPTDSRGVQIIKNGPALRQILVAKGLVDIVAESNSKYSVSLYPRSKVGSLSGGLYQLNGNPAPLVKWTVENVSEWHGAGNVVISRNDQTALAGHAITTQSCDRVCITRWVGTSKETYLFIYKASTGGWTLNRNGAKQESVRYIWNEEHTQRRYTYQKGGVQADPSNGHETGGIVGPGGVYVGARHTETRQTYSWGEQVAEREDELGRKTVQSWFDTPNDAGRYAKRQSVVNPDGSWERFDYDSQGRLTKTVSNFKDSPVNAPESDSKVTLTSYDPLDAADVPLLWDNRPRTVTEMVQGKVVGRTYHAYLTQNGALSEVEERAATTTAIFGAVDNIRTVKNYFSPTGGGGVNGPACAGQLKSIVYPDGRQDSYTYAFGSVANPGTPVVSFLQAGGFIPNEDTSAMQVTITHGTTNNPSGIAGKTTQETLVYDASGNQVLTGTAIYDGTVHAAATWSARAFDDQGHVTRVWQSNGTTEETEWGANCCGKESEKTADGVERSFGYDLLHQMTSVTQVGTNSPTDDRRTDYIYDLDGRRVSETLSGGSLRWLVNSNSFDEIGRLIIATDGSGVASTYSYSADGLSSTVTRGDLTATTVRYADGRPKYTQGNGVLKSWNEYGVNTDGTQWAVTYTGPAGTNSPMWQKTTSDLLGRTIRTDKPGFGGVIQATVYAYNGKGQLASTTQQPNNLTTLYEYNELGEQTRSGLDLNGNGVLDLAGPDRISESAIWFTQDGANNAWQVRASLVYAGPCAVPTTNSIQKTRLTGLGTVADAGLVTSEAVSIDLLGNQTVQKTFIDRTAKTVTQVVTYPDSINSAEQITINGSLALAISKTGVKTDYGHDALGRQIAAIQSGSGRTVGSYTAYNALGQVASTMDAASNKTTFAYDAQGRRITVTDALTNSTFTAYDAQGRVLATWGATYPVAYDFDDYGRMTAMYTYRGNASISSFSEISNLKSEMDRTRWLYDEATGLLTNKLYSDNHGPSYTYTADGKLASRTWARGIVTTYSYDPANQLTGVSYSDNTPATTFAYNRLGQQSTITDATGTRTFTYNDALQLAAETNTQGVLQYTFDSQGRPFGLDAGPNYSVRYSFDNLGRFAAVSNNMGGALRAATYSYVPGSDLVAGYVTGEGFSLMRSYEPNRNLIASITNSFGTVPLRRFDYVNDEVGRRVQRKDVDISTVISNLFSYNTRSELTGAQMNINNFQCVYDPIGNRISATNNAEAWSYAANSLNQYSQLTNNQSPITPTYDLDGNMTGYKDWTFAWDAENRLILASNATTVVSNSYDYMSRRVSKTVSALESEIWNLKSEIHFTYQGWTLLSEISNMKSEMQTNKSWFVYGLDLSGTTQGAGTIGGILSLTTQQPSNSTTAFFGYDANGNVAVLAGTNGAVLASYLYDPFGRTLSQSGDFADVNPFRFSTKYNDSEMGLYNFGLRFLQPETGRWVSSDPIKERGGENLFSFVQNRPLDFTDYRGLSINDPPGSLPTGCCDGKSYVLAWACCCNKKIVGRAPVGIGVKKCCIYDVNSVKYKFGRYPEHCYISSGGKAWGLYPHVGLSTGIKDDTYEDKYTPDGAPDPTKALGFFKVCEEIKFDPCQYDLAKVKACAARGGKPHVYVTPFYDCRDWASSAGNCLAGNEPECK